ncbi:arginine ABC transporter permease [Bacillus sp. FJAT-27264]|uniref:amino acid ABC transporter permease n=1 Tax=Paenibacillus sp. (strain DSM 101736 / FJAT-27264) TaxID=1850362 RepID=UPI00080817F1|nr:amino acid ABC transporter permease [Bacillus sp. FJAT-27264]OBZ19417.1 arginine ABC transporter permease [Bacillus sp. FJAT-27264]
MLDFSSLDRYIPKFLEGLKVTIGLSIATVILATILGFIIYFMKASKTSIGKFRPISAFAVLFIELMRGTPLLLQILLVFSGGKMLLGIDISAFESAVIAITLNASAFIAEIVRAGIEAVDKGQMEAARSLGMSRSLAMRLVIMPQAIKNILPAIGNEFVNIIKASSMASVIGVGELTLAAKIVQGATYLALEPLIISAVFYLILTFSLGRLMGWIERRLKSSDIR